MQQTENKPLTKEFLSNFPVHGNEYEEFKPGDLVEVRCIGYEKWQEERFYYIGRQKRGLYVVEAGCGHLITTIAECRRPPQTTEEWSQAWIARNRNAMSEGLGEKAYMKYFTDRTEWENSAGRL